MIKLIKTDPDRWEVKGMPFIILNKGYKYAAGNRYEVKHNGQHVLTRTTLAEVRQGIEETVNKALGQYFAK